MTPGAGLRRAGLLEHCTPRPGGWVSAQSAGPTPHLRWWGQGALLSPLSPALGSLRAARSPALLGGLGPTVGRRGEGLAGSSAALTPLAGATSPRGGWRRFSEVDTGIDLDGLRDFRALLESMAGEGHRGGGGGGSDSRIVKALRGHPMKEVTFGEEDGGRAGPSWERRPGNSALDPVDLDAIKEEAQESAKKSLAQDFGDGAVRLMERIARTLGRTPLRSADQQERTRQEAELLELQAHLERSRLQSRERLRQFSEPRPATQAEAEDAEPEGADLLRPLDVEEAKLYSVAMNKKGDPEEILAINEGAHLHISRGDLACMRAPEWLNDEAVNFYMALLNDRDARDREGPGRFPRCHFFNTFFYAKLEKDGYKGVRRWSLPKKLVYKHKDIHSACDRIVFPIHRPGHWTAAMVDVKGQRIVYLDSMSLSTGRTHEVAEALAEWYKLDRADKKKEDLPVDRWPIELWECPQQRNGYDCGMFAAKFCDFLGRDADFSFGQEHMGLFRKRLVAEICRNRAE